MRDCLVAFLRLCKPSAVVLAAFLCIVPANAYAVQEDEFGPVVRAYLGYLRNEQEVVDDRASRREVSAAYYRHNSNRFAPSRQIAIQIARETRTTICRA